MADRKAAVKRRRKGVEFMAGLGNGSPFFLFKKRNPASLSLEQTRGRDKSERDLENSYN